MKRLLLKILLFVGLGSLLFAVPEVVSPFRSTVLGVESEGVSKDHPSPSMSKEEVPLRLEYSADIGSGIIGAPVQGQVDEAYDNVFIVVLDEQPSDNDVVWLTYELSGAPDHDAVPRSINDGRSTGGNMLRRSSGWHAGRKDDLAGTTMVCEPRSFILCRPRDIVFTGQHTARRIRADPASMHR